MADETYLNFSQRYGYEPVRDVIQLESMDDPLRNGLWSMLKIFVWDRARHLHGVESLYLLSDDRNKAIKSLCWFLWIDYFKEPVRLEFPILSLHPGLRPRGVAPDVWPTLSRA